MKFYPKRFGLLKLKLIFDNNFLKVIDDNKCYVYGNVIMAVGVKEEKKEWSNYLLVTITAINRKKSKWRQSVGQSVNPQIIY